MYDIVTVGSATVDVFLRSNRFRIGDRGRESLTLSGGKIEVEEKLAATGGGGTNTAVGFSRLGLDCASVARFGNDWAGEWLERDLAKETFDKRYLRKVDGEETDFSVILLSPTGERIVLVHRGKNRVDKTIFPLEILASTRWLYLASLEGNVDLLIRLVDQARRYNVSVVLNPGNRELAQKEVLKGVLSKVKVLIVNEEEAKFFWGEGYREEIKNLKMEIVVVTCGKEGAYFWQGGEMAKEPAWEGKVVDATGAGDAFSTGLVAGLIWNYPLLKAVQAGMAESLSVVGKIGAKAGLLTKSQLEERLADQNDGAGEAQDDE